MCVDTHRKNTAFCDICGIFSHKIIKRVQKTMLTGYSEGIRKEEKEENGQKVNVNPNLNDNVNENEYEGDNPKVNDDEINGD